MNNLKKIMIIIVFIILIILIILFALTQMVKKNEENENAVTEIAENKIEVPQTEDDEEVDELKTNKVEYLRIIKCLDQYVYFINLNDSSYYSYDENGNYSKVVEDETINQNIYNMLSEDYINKKSITLNNVQEYVYKIEEPCSCVPVSIKKEAETENIKSYSVYGIIVNSNYENPIESCLILNIDEANRTFSIEQLENKDELENIEVSKITSIENKGNNIYRDSSNVDIEIIQNYFTNYKKLALVAPEIAYENLLDDEYKQKRFGSVEKYKQYIETNRENIKVTILREYKTEVSGETAQYIGVDQKGKSYFFNAKTASDYKVILDYYTVDVPQFKEVYEKAKEEEKVGYNINKCIDAINDFDYGYMYSKLDDNFKNNNYPTEESFEQAIKEIFFEKNETTNLYCSQEGEVYRGEVNIVNAENSLASKTIVFIMKLEEGTNFVMSFSAE